MSRRVPPTRSLLRCALASSAALITAVAAPAVGGAVGSPSTALFGAPSAITAIGPWVVVANRAPASLTILAASDGALVRHVNRAGLGVGAPTSLVATTVAGRRIVLVAGAGGLVSELSLAPRGPSIAVTRLRILRPVGCGAGGAAHLAAYGVRGVVEACADGVVSIWGVATGALVRTIAAVTTGVTNATGLAVLGSTADVTNAATAAPGSAPDGVTQLSLVTGARLRTVTDALDSAYAFSSPSSIASDGTDLWEINATGSTVDELSGSTLRFMATSSTNLSSPAVVAATPTTVWVSSSGSAWSSSMVTQFQVVNQALQSPWMMCNSNGPYQFSDPSGFAVHGGTLWVVNATNALVDKMNASSGALIATYS